MAKPGGKPDPDFEPDCDTPDPDYDEGAQPDCNDDFSDPDALEASQEYYKRSQK